MLFTLDFGKTFFILSRNAFALGVSLPAIRGNLNTPTPGIARVAISIRVAAAALSPDLNAPFTPASSSIAAFISGVNAISTFLF